MCSIYSAIGRALQHYRNILVLTASPPPALIYNKASIEIPYLLLHHLSLIIIVLFLHFFFVFVVGISICLQGPEQIHVSKFYKESKNGKFVSYITENVRTLYQTFREGAYASNNGPCLGWRETLTSPYQVSRIHSSPTHNRNVIHCLSYSGSIMMKLCCVLRILVRA